MKPHFTFRNGFWRCNIHLESGKVAVGVGRLVEHAYEQAVRIASRM